MTKMKEGQVWCEKRDQRNELRVGFTYIYDQKDTINKGITR